MLTPTQKEAVEEFSQPLVIKAGPGTGKTMLLVEKIVHLIKNKLALPTQILSLTFTQKASKELASRVEARTGNIFMSYTFHSFALSILQTISKTPENIRVLKDVDSIHFLLQKIKQYGFDEELKKDALFLAKEFYKTINSLRDLGIFKQKVELVEFDSMKTKQCFIQLNADYESFKRKTGMCDFHDLELRLYGLLQKKEEIGKKIASLYPYIIVDEFQDTSPLQCKILEKIAQYNKHITAVGDEKQSIYGFRGTHTNSFETFQTMFSNTKTLYLKEQFRSSSLLIDATNKYIEELVDEKEQLLIAQKSQKGSIKYITCKDENEQYEHILGKIEIFRKQNPHKTLAIVARTHSQLKELINYASQYGVSINYGQEDIFHSPSIEKILSYLHIIANPKQSEKFVLHILQNTYLPQFVVQFILHQAKSYESDIYTFIKRYGVNPYSRPLQEIYLTHPKDVEFLCNKLKEILTYIEEFESHKRIKRTVLNIMQNEELYEKALSYSDSKLLSNYNSFLEFIMEYERSSQSSPHMQEFLSYLQTAKDLHHNILDSNLEIKSNISALTIHQAKGKEFDEVCILQCIEKSYPLPFRDEFIQHKHSITKKQAMDEELRLFFVACSRAKESLEFLVPEFNNKGTPLKESPYIDIVKSLYSIEKPLTHSLFKPTTISKEILSKLIGAMQNDDFKHAKELFKQYELSKTSQKDLRHFENESNSINSQMYQKKNEDGSYKRRVYSVSQIKTYQLCPKKYYYSYICRLPQEPKHFFSFGTTMHQVFELLMPLFEEGTQSREDIIMQGLHLLSMHWRSLGYQSVVQEREYFQKALRGIEDFVDTEIKRRKEGITNESQEEEFIVEVGEKKYPILGYIDRIDNLKDNNLTIIDYKTSKSMPYMSQIREDLQLYTYALATKQIKGKYPKSMALWFVIHNRIAQVEFKEEVMNKVEEQLIEGIEQIESNNFEATPSYFGCTYCDFKDICKDSLK